VAAWLLLLLLLLLRAFRAVSQPALSAANTSRSGGSHVRSVGRLSGAKWDSSTKFDRT
jgi:hypothetical protein